MCRTTQVKEYSTRKKAEQQLINDVVINAIDYYNNELTAGEYYHRVDTCQAWWKDIINPDTGEVVGTLLISYNMLVAFTIGGVMYDFLRYVYGYTATSAKHIAKFRKFTSPTTVYTYRPV